MQLEWIGILVCLVQSAIFSGLNLGFFGLSRLRLAVQADAENKDAQRILNLRKEAHLLLATLLWGNVASNVLLALFAESIFTGIGAFLFSTVGITFFGEIIPQAYLVKNTLKVSVFLVPIVRFYQFLLYPITKPTAYLLDKWLGKEEILYFQEKEIEFLLKRHANASVTDLDFLEASGAVNFLKIDDIKIEEEGEILNPESIISLKTDQNNKIIFPTYENTSQDPFLQKLNHSEEKWVVLVNEKDEPVLVLNADEFLRDVIYKQKHKSILSYCHKPIIIKDPETTLGEAMLQFKVHAKNSEDDVVDNDIILFWNKEKRVITGADILGRLLRGIIPVK